MVKNHPKRSRQIIRSFEAQELKKRSFALKIADALTLYFGTLHFLIFNLVFFIVWVMINNGAFPPIPIFDPYPHVLLTTAVSLEAIILAIIVLISQNRENQVSTLREELELQVGLITEREITKILRLLNQLLKERGIKVEDPELKEMLETIKPSYIERKLKNQIEGKPTSTSKKKDGPIAKVRKEVRNNLLEGKEKIF